MSNQCYESPWMNAVDPTCEIFVPLIVVGIPTVIILAAITLTIIARHYLNKYWPLRPAWIN